MKRGNQPIDLRIRPLAPADADAYQDLRLRGLREAPEAFGSTFEEDVELAHDVVAERLAHILTPHASVVLGAWRDATLLGFVGAVQHAKHKTRHTAFVWGMYVTPEARGEGIGRLLMDALLAEVRCWPEVERLTLSVVERAGAARRLYSVVGFTEFGREVDAFRQAGVRDTALHLELRLGHTANVAGLTETDADRTAEGSAARRAHRRRRADDAQLEQQNRDSSPHPAPRTSTFVAAQPQLFVQDVVASCDFYSRMLGFSVGFSYGEPPFYAQVVRDGVRLNLRHVDEPVVHPARREAEQLLAATITLDDASRVHDEYLRTGIELAEPLTTQPWGARTFIVRDPDGNLLLFAE